MRAQGFGVQSPASVQLPVQAARTVTVHVPSDAQQEPVAGFVGPSLPPQFTVTIATNIASNTRPCMVTPPSSRDSLLRSQVLVQVPPGSQRPACCPVAGR